MPAMPRPGGRRKGTGCYILYSQAKRFHQFQVLAGKHEKRIAETIRKGHGPMPAFVLKPDEIKAIVDYMSHAFGKAK